MAALNVVFQIKYNEEVNDFNEFLHINQMRMACFTASKIRKKEAMVANKQLWEPQMCTLHICAQ